MLKRFCPRLFSTSSCSAAYAKLITELYEVNLLQGPVKQGLQNVTELHNAVGRPLFSPTIGTRVHVSGTNGKGSVCLKLARALRWQNKVNGVNGGGVGLFVSPHVTSFRERMLVDDVAISEAEVVELLPPILEATREHRIPATFFEILTVLAFAFYKHRGANAVVLECGLGGRLDATNIVHPSVAVVTTVDLDHTRILGDTPELIATEKAGIIKPGVPAVLGPAAKPHSVFFAASEAAGGGSHCVVASPLSAEVLAACAFAPGDVDAENTAVALETLRVLGVVDPEFDLADIDDADIGQEELRTALLSRPSCRFELWQAEECQGDFSMSPISRLPQSGELPADGARVILDVAHNPSGIAGLFQKLCGSGGGNNSGGGGGGREGTEEETVEGRRRDKDSPPLHVVMGMSGDKDLDACMAAVADHLDAKHGDRITFVQGTHPRAAEASELAGAFVRNDGSAVVAFQHDGSGDGGDLVRHEAGVPLSGTLKEILRGIVRRAVREGKSAGVPNRPAPVVVICGSIYIMSEVRNALEIVLPGAPVDPPSLQEVWRNKRDRKGAAALDLPDIDAGSLKP